MYARSCVAVRVPELPAADLDHVLVHADHAWRSLRGAHVVITGASGFVGSWMLESLVHANRAAALGAAITATVRDARGFAERHPHLAGARDVTVVEGDVRAVRIPATVTHLVHCASATAPAENTADPDEVTDIIVSGTAHMLGVAGAGDGVRFLQMSSGSVYGPQPPALDRIPESFVGEADPAIPAQRFGAAKRAAERLGAAALTRGTGFTAARGFALIGPRLPLDREFAVGNFIANVLVGRPVEVRGDGTPLRSWLYAADLAVWCWMILVHGTAGSAYNVGSDEVIPIGEAARRIASHAASPHGVVIRGTSVPGAPAQRFIPDVTRARSDLRVDVRIRFDDAVTRTLAWWRR